MRNGLYKTCNMIIARHLKSGKNVIDINKCLKEAMAVADFSGMDEEELQATVLKLMLTSALNSSNFYSVIRRKGYYANVDNCNKAYLKAIINNAQTDVKRFETLLEKLNKRIEVAEIDGQMEFDFDTNEIIEQLTQEQLLQMLEEEAG